MSDETKEKVETVMCAACHKYPGVIKIDIGLVLRNGLKLQFHRAILNRNALVDFFDKGYADTKTWP